MKLLIFITTLIFTPFVFASVIQPLTTGIDCGELPVPKESGNTEDVVLKCQISSKYRIKIEKKEYQLIPDRFYKLYIEHRDGDEYAYLMYNGQQMDKSKTQEMHIELAGYGIGLYEYVEWRMIPTEKGPHFLGLILGKVLRPEYKNEAGELVKAQIVYQTFKLDRDKSCALNLLSLDLEEARRISDRLKCN